MAVLFVTCSCTPLYGRARSQMLALRRNFWIGRWQIHARMHSWRLPKQCLMASSEHTLCPASLAETSWSEAPHWLLAH